MAVAFGKSHRFVFEAHSSHLSVLEEMACPVTSAASRQLLPRGGVAMNQKEVLRDQEKVQGLIKSSED